MGFDCGFDIHPRLSPSNPADKQAYQAFLDDIIATYQSTYDSEGCREDGKVLQLPGDPAGIFAEDNYCISFMVGECPSMPARAERCDYFLRFSSKVSGRLWCAEPYIRAVYRMAKRRFGGRVHWWDELNDLAEDEREWGGFYNWTEVYAASKELKALEAGEGHKEEGNVDSEHGNGGGGQENGKAVA